VKFFNVDNNTSNNSITPVMITLNKSPAAQRKRKSQYFLDMRLRINHNAEAVTIIDDMRISISPLTITLDEEYTDVILEGIKEFMAEYEEKYDETFDFQQTKPKPLSSLLFQSPSKRVTINPKISFFEGANGEADGEAITQ
jgi:hypothetical protein